MVFTVDTATRAAPPGCIIQTTGWAFRMGMDMPVLAMVVLLAAVTLAGPTTQAALAIQVPATKAAAGRPKPIAVFPPAPREAVATIVIPRARPTRLTMRASHRVTHLAAATQAPARPAMAGPRRLPTTRHLPVEDPHRRITPLRNRPVMREAGDTPAVMAIPVAADTRTAAPTKSSREPSDESATVT